MNEPYNKQQLISYLEHFIECVKEDRFFEVELSIVDDKEHGYITLDDDPNGFAEYNTIRIMKFTGSMRVKLIKIKKDLPFIIPDAK